MLYILAFSLCYFYRFSPPFCLDIAVVCSVYVVVGYFGFRFFKSRSNLYFLVPLALVAFGYYLGLDGVNLSTRFYGNFANFVFASSFSFLLFYLFFAIYGVLRLEVLSFIGLYSLLFFALHPYANNFAFLVACKIGGGYILQFAISLIVLYAMVYGLINIKSRLA